MTEFASTVHEHYSMMAGSNQPQSLGSLYNKEKDKVMDLSIKLRRGEQLRDAYKSMRAEGRWPKPQEPERISGTVQMFPTEEARQLHLMQVAEAQASGSPF